MKALFAVVLCLCFLLCGCNTQTDLPNDQTTAPPVTDSQPAPTDGVSIPYTEPLIAVATPMITENTIADDGVRIFTYSYQDMVLTMEDPVVAETITDDFLHRNDLSVSAQPVLDAAKTAYTGQQDWMPYSCSVLYDPVRLDQSILSFFGTEVIDNGSPRSTSTNISVTYDLITGKALTLEEILTTGYSAEELVSKILASIEDLSQQGLLFTDYEYIISDLFSTNTPMERWYFSNNGLCFFFTPYEIAPYNAGTVIAEVPYSELIGILKAAYFPAEQVTFDGTLNAVKADSADLDTYSRFTEVILDNQGTEYLIAPQGTALDVRLQIGTWGDSFTPAYTAYAATALTDGDALMVQLPQDLQNSIAIRYNELTDQKIIP